MSDCQPFTGLKDRQGYGAIDVYVNQKHKRISAHRLAWALANGADPDGKVVRHTCDNPPCVNPEHLIIGTHLDNMADKVARGRQKHGEEYRHHKLTDNSVVWIRANVGFLSWRDMASILGVSKSAVGAVVRGRAWKHVCPLQDFVELVKA